MVKRIITGLVGFVLLMSCFSAFGEAKPKKICEIKPRENIVRYTYVDQEGKATVLLHGELPGRGRLIFTPSAFCLTNTLILKQNISKK